MYGPKTKNKKTGPYQFLHFLTSACLITSLIACTLKSAEFSDLGSRVLLISTWRLARIHKKKGSCSAWKDEEVESLIDIFSEETIRRHFVLEELRKPGSSIQLHQLP